MRVLVPVLLSLSAGCAVVDAPATLEELAVFGFVNFDVDEAHTSAAVVELEPLLARHDEALVEGMRIDSLRRSDLREAGLGGGVESGVTGLSLVTRMDADLDAFAAAWSHPHMERVVESTLDFEILAEEGDRACFLAGDCATYAYEGWREGDMGLFGTSETEFVREFRWSTAADGRPALVIRELAPDGSEMGGSPVKIHQQFGWSVVLPAEGGGTERFDAYWVDAEVIGLDLPDSIALDTAVKGLGQTAEDVDAFVAGA